MYLRSDERGPAMSNRLAVRIAIFGGVSLVLFTILFFRLWSLQVVKGEEYLAEANNNRTREYRVVAPRGTIVDRNGEVLVQSHQPRPAAQPAQTLAPGPAAPRRAG